MAVFVLMIQLEQINSDIKLTGGQIGQDKIIIGTPVRTPRSSPSFRLDGYN